MTSRCSRDALENFTRATLSENLQVKCRGPRPRRRLRATFAIEMQLEMSSAILCKTNTKKCRGPRARHRLFVRACAVENAIGNVARATLCENLQIECRGPRARHRLCSSLRNRNAFRKCGNVTRAALCRRAKPATQTLRGPAQSKCTWKCHKSHFVRKFTGKMPSTGLYSSRKNPSV